MSLSRISRSGIKSTTSPQKSPSLQNTCGLPGPVQSTSGSATGNTTASISWSAPTNSSAGSVTSYTVTGGGTPSVSGTSATISGLAAGTQYTWKVTAVNSLGSGVTTTLSPVTTTNWNAATGGTTTDVSNYNGTGQTWRVHTFTSNGTLNITKAASEFRVLVVGGGGMGRAGTCGTGGAGCWGNGGGGGGWIDDSRTLNTGSHSISIGAGGTNYNTPSGGTTTFGSISCTGGGSGSGTGSSSGGSPNGYSSGAGPRYTTITGTSMDVGWGGSTPNNPIRQGYGSGGIGAQRTGGDYDDGTGSYGKPGVVIVAYRIA